VPAVSSAGTGEFRARVDVASELIEYELTYDGTRGTVTQAHIHLGQRTANGGIALWLCANNPPIAAAPAGTQTCPVRGTITGVLVAKDVVGIAVQALPAAGIRDAIAAIRAGAMCVNVHTTTVPSGELRGQLDPRWGGGDHHHH
jgi:CHRD domain